MTVMTDSIQTDPLLVQLLLHWVKCETQLIDYFNFVSNFNISTCLILLDLSVYLSIDLSVHRNLKKKKKKKSNRVVTETSKQLSFNVSIIELSIIYKLPNKINQFVTEASKD